MPQIYPELSEKGLRSANMEIPIWRKAHGRRHRELLARVPLACWSSPAPSGGNLSRPENQPAIARAKAIAEALNRLEA